MKSAILAVMLVVFSAGAAHAACKIDPRTGDCPLPAPDITEPQAEAATVDYGERSMPGTAGRWAFGAGCASGAAGWGCHAHAELNATLIILDCVVSLTRINCTLCVLGEGDQCHYSEAPVPGAD